MRKLFIFAVAVAPLGAVVAYAQQTIPRLL